VLNNRALGWVKHGQLEREEATFKSQLHDFDLAAIAMAIGCHASRVEDPDLLSAALREAISSGSPAVVEVVVSTAETYVDLRSPLVSGPPRVS
jgi:thiamine pyrophosphate-dependent acetolactate synthase large subunit-like protein